ncbi:nitroreductase family protein [Treponema sp. TIM-1]|uniref:nitroreductase family protein n=1 Tax=Treponema sp. TIM-1 TaxID=2898417 RepID=UPI0039805160
MKKQVTGIFLLLLALPGFGRGSSDLGAQELKGAESIINHYAAQNFAAGDITRAELDTILAAGVRSPSARNRQPWHFTVVRNRTLANQIVPNITEGNILIIISAAGDGKTNGAEILDCALATQSIYLAAQALGLGSRIYTGPINAVNSRFKGDLGLPNGYSAVALVRIGRLPPGADAVSGASSRKAADSMVTYK